MRKLADELDLAIALKFVVLKIRSDFDRMQPEFFNVQFDGCMRPHRWSKTIDLISQQTQQAQRKQQAV